MTEPRQLRTQRSCIDEATRRAKLTFDWLLEAEHAAGTHRFSADNLLQVLVCGQEAFGQLAADIESARHSIDIVCWGFDPAMELVRGSAPGWPRGTPYGQLLDDAVARGVHVRLLAWHEAGFAAREQNNLPGYTGDMRHGRLISRPSLRPDRDAFVRAHGGDGRSLHEDVPTDEDRRADYCVLWWRRALEDGPGDASRLQCRFRQADDEHVRASLHSETDAPSRSAGQYFGLVHEKRLIEKHASHHQKTVLIDYAFEGGQHAVGYVLGLNSLTDYWDDEAHAFDSPHREVDWACRTDTAKALGRAVSRDPYRDYACCIAGPALQPLQRNFLQAWVRAGGRPRSDDVDALPASIRRVHSPYRAQIVRTQPEEGDKTVQGIYLHAPTYARRYLYIENQYFFYEPWARALKAIRRRHVGALRDCAPEQADDAKPLHLFIVIPHAENEGMVPRTYDTLKSLGEGESFPNQDREMKEAAERLRTGRARPGETRDDIVRSAMAVESPTKDLETEELEGLQMKVLVARLVSVNRGEPLEPPEANVRQVYVHSKLMLIDDCFFTLGSANLNQRSMAADSELNVATDDHVEAQRLRRRAWGTLTGWDQKAEGQGASPREISAAFATWGELMDDNARNLTKLSTLPQVKGLIVPFIDKRTADYRVG